MASPSYLKPLHYPHVYSMKYPSPSTTTLNLSNLKLKNLLHTFILSHLCRIASALTKAKSLFIELLKQIQLMHFIGPSKKHKNKNNKLFFGSFRLHYNWCSSHVAPLPPSPGLHRFPTSQSFYDATWNSVISPYCHDLEEPQLSSYLHWLEKKVQEETKKTDEVNDIDKLADMFIANCREKFILEKQESYRMFQEMMARSL